MATLFGSNKGLILRGVAKKSGAPERWFSQGQPPRLCLVKYISFNKDPLPLIVTTFHPADGSEVYSCKKTPLCWLVDLEQL